MRSKDFQSVLQAASSVITNKQPAPSVLKESIEQLNEGEVVLINEINDILQSVEKQLQIRLTDNEVQESTEFILNLAQINSLVEQIETEVGFELNEHEVQYVIDKFIAD